MVVGTVVIAVAAGTPRETTVAIPGCEIVREFERTLNQLM